jgi:predicted DNA-binding transcriptional regulator
MVAQYSDAIRHRKEKDEQKEEMLRLQALRQNDMVAYAKLVQETKNVRLNYLMNQTVLTHSPTYSLT